jgi:hypothetical protein
MPYGITSGPDGALWFTNAVHSGSIGRITTSGVVSNFTGTGIETPLGITSGPDGALWFTNVNNNSIGRITTSGVVSDYPGTGFNPLGITAGPDGALWFTNSNSNSIGRITTAGVISDYVGSGIDYPDAIVAGVDGALWFTNANNNSIGRITTDGGITNYADTTIDFPWGITAGPDGDLWFANEDNASIGRITSLPRVFISPASGAPGSSVAVSGSGYRAGERHLQDRPGRPGPLHGRHLQRNRQRGWNFQLLGSRPSRFDRRNCRGSRDESNRQGFRHYRQDTLQFDVAVTTTAA